MVMGITNDWHMTAYQTVRAAFTSVLFVSGVGCADVHSAGSLGMLVNGETRLRPLPENYRHVPPRMEEPGPLLFKRMF